MRFIIKEGGEGELLAFTDSDYAGDMENRKSTSGYVFLMGSSVVSGVRRNSLL